MRKQLFLGLLLAASCAFAQDLPPYQGCSVYAQTARGAPIYAAMQASSLSYRQLLEHGATRLGFGWSPFGSVWTDLASNPCMPVNFADSIGAQISSLTAPSEPAEFEVIRAGLAPFTTFPRADVNNAILRIRTAKGPYTTVLRNAYLQTSYLKTLRELVGSQWVIRGHVVDGEVDLRDLLTEFWFNHFNVDTTKTPQFVHGSNGYAEHIRTLVGGTFYGLLEGVIETPAMMVYLDNQLNVFDPAGDAAGNQNLGRELLELHTFGLGPKVSPTDPTSIYDQHDVEGMAKILSGANVVSYSQSQASSSTSFVFLEQLAAREDVTFLGHVYPVGSSARLRMETVLRMLANHPQTRLHICTKLASLFYAPMLVAGGRDACLAAWGQDGQLQEMYRALISRPEFWSAANYRTLVRTPLESVVSASRQMGVNLLDLESSVRAEHLTATPFHPSKLNTKTFNAANKRYLAAHSTGFLNFHNRQVQALSGVWPTMVTPPTGYRQDGSAYYSTGYLEALSLMPLEIAGTFEDLRGTRTDKTAGSITAFLVLLSHHDGWPFALRQYAEQDLQMGYPFTPEGVFTFSPEAQLEAGNIVSVQTLWPYRDSDPSARLPNKGFPAVLLATPETLKK